MDLRRTHRRRMNLKQWADRQGVSYTTARRWFAAGRLPVPARRVGGLILVGEPASPERPGLTAVYVPVKQEPGTVHAGKTGTASRQREAAA